MFYKISTWLKKRGFVPVERIFSLIEFLVGSLLRLQLKGGTIFSGHPVYDWKS
jgi:hypothetical protein